MKSMVMLIIFLSASRLAPSTLMRGTVIWNVGQGQWVTIADQDTCRHFDMGGEFFPWASLKKLCGHRHNEVFLSHWDWDHIGALAQSKISRTFPLLCLRAPPLGESSLRKMQLLRRFGRCSGKKMELDHWSPLKSKNSNDSSQVFLYKSLLMPGDSTKKQEELWSRKSWVPSTRVLLLGHHGSNTSTSEALLKRLSRVKLAVSSARWRRYSHPHPQTAARLKHFHIPLLRTEDWGHIWFE